MSGGGGTTLGSEGGGVHVVIPSLSHMTVIDGCVSDDDDDDNDGDDDDFDGEDDADDFAAISRCSLLKLPVKLMLP